MSRKRWVRLILILLPLLLLIVQISWQPEINQPHRIKRALQVLVPPFGIVFRYFDFNERNALAKWEEKIFQGRVAYWIDFKDSDGFIHSKSMQATSAIFYRIKFNISDYPYLSWKWRVGKFPDKSKVINTKKRDDFAARLYVVFVSHFFTNFRCIEYIWDEFLPEGTILTSPYTDQIKQIVVQNGPSSPHGFGKSSPLNRRRVRPRIVADVRTNPPSILADKPNEWVQETRNVFDDYKKLFGELPKMKVTAIALMTNASGTRTEAEGFFDDIRIGAHRVGQ